VLKMISLLKKNDLLPAFGGLLKIEWNGLREEAILAIDQALMDAEAPRLYVHWI
jgi:hypothetical protein